MRILPFRTASPGSVEWTAPVFELDGAQYPVGPLPEWTYQSAVRVLGQVKVLADEFRASTGLDSLDDVRAVMQAECLSTGYRECVSLAAKDAAGTARTMILDVPAGETADDLEIRYWLVWVGADTAPNDQLSVHLPGGRLHSDGQVYRAQLEGDGAGFPSEAFSFAEGRVLPPGALWLLSFRPDLDQPFMANARVFINTDHERHGDLLTNRATAAKQVLFHGVLQQMFDTVAFAVDPADVVPDSFEDASTGEVLNKLSETYLGNDLALTIQQLREDRARTLARLQEATGLLTGAVK